MPIVGHMLLEHCKHIRCTVCSPGLAIPENAPEAEAKATQLCEHAETLPQQTIGRLSSLSHDIRQFKRAETMAPALLGRLPSSDGTIWQAWQHASVVVEGQVEGLSQLRDACRPALERSSNFRARRVKHHGELHVARLRC